jgi:hypothetical protein
VPVALLSTDMVSKQSLIQSNHESKGRKTLSIYVQVTCVRNRNQSNSVTLGLITKNDLEVFYVDRVNDSQGLTRSDDILIDVNRFQS